MGKQNPYIQKKPPCKRSYNKYKNNEAEEFLFQNLAYLVSLVNLVSLINFADLVDLKIKSERTMVSLVCLVDLVDSADDGSDLHEVGPCPGGEDNLDHLSNFSLITIQANTGKTI